MMLLACKWVVEYVGPFLNSTDLHDVTLCNRYLCHTLYDLLQSQKTRELTTQNTKTKYGIWCSSTSNEADLSLFPNLKTLEIYWSPSVGGRLLNQGSCSLDSMTIFSANPKDPPNAPFVFPLFPERFCSLSVRHLEINMQNERRVFWSHLPQGAETIKLIGTLLLDNGPKNVNLRKLRVTKIININVDDDFPNVATAMPNLTSLKVVSFDNQRRLPKKEMQYFPSSLVTLEIFRTRYKELVQDILETQIPNVKELYVYNTNIIPKELSKLTLGLVNAPLNFSNSIHFLKIGNFDGRLNNYFLSLSNLQTLILDTVSAYVGNFEQSNMPFLSTLRHLSLPANFAQKMVSVFPLFSKLSALRITGYLEKTDIKLPGSLQYLEVENIQTFPARPLPPNLKYLILTNYRKTILESTLPSGLIVLVLSLQCQDRYLDFRFPVSLQYLQLHRSSKRKPEHPYIWRDKPTISLERFIDLEQQHK